MKARVLALMSGMTLFALLANPTRPATQGQLENAESKRGAETGTANPVPLINQPLVPDAIAPGSAGFTLTVNGTGFVSGSLVNWNGSALATTFVNGSQLTTAVPAADVAAAGTASVTVANPSPGGGTSNLVYLPVANATSSIILSQSQLSSSNFPDMIAVADFNGDGSADLAVVNPKPNTVSIFLGNGDGTFQPHVDYATGYFPVRLAVGDFNGDGRLDLVTADQGNGKVSILLGNGDGTFGPRTDYVTGSSAYGVAIGDFNGDGKADLAVAELFDNAVSVLLGNGDGSFQPYVEYSTGIEPTFAITADFNGDGKLDLAVPNSNAGSGTTISVLLGNGDGTFQNQLTYATGTQPDGMAAADFNGDGVLDIAVANIGSNTVSILLGIGDGTFQPHADYVVSQYPVSIAVGDLNGDGKLDLSVVNDGANTVSTLLGNGDGSFQSHVEYAVGNSPISIAVGDFDGDGKLDLAVPNSFGNTVSVLLQVAAAPLVTLSPTNLNFGTQLIGAGSAAQTVTLSNTGNATLDITSITATSHFRQGTTCGSNLAAGASCNIRVNFTPSGAGTETGTLAVNDNAPGSPQTVSLIGVGTVVSLTPTSLSFGNQPVGTTSSAQTVTLTNHAAGTLRISGVRITGGNSGWFAQTNTCGSSLAAGASCTFSVTFTPGATGSGTAILNISDNGGGSPQTVSLTGTGT